MRSPGRRKEAVDVELGLEGRVFVVTGGSDGLGRALSETLVAEGSRVAMCARDPDRLGATVAELDKAGGEVLGVVADVRRLEDLVTLVDRTLERWGRVDGLVNNAGRSAAKPVTEIADDEWTEDLELKLLAAARLVRLTVPHMRANGGSIVNVLSVAARAPGAASGPSSVSRAAGLALTKTLSKELGGDRIRVNAVLIGLVESGQWRRAAEADGTPLPEFYSELAGGARIPLGRIGRADEFADVVSYLLSDRASYVTGTAINIDGGLSSVP
jgi:NAD(P)-dependent dehydrogenase (short-subunit alcohol dehydrogenase family)